MLIVVSHSGRTDCPISGVFGAGKTLSVAAMIAGLLVMDPTLQIMIVAKENVAACAFAKHFLRLGLPDSICGNFYIHDGITRG